MLGSVYDWVLDRAADTINAVSGRITPSAEIAVRKETREAIVKAGGTSEDVARAMREITNVLQDKGGSTLPAYGGHGMPTWDDVLTSPGVENITAPLGINLKWWLLGGLGGVALILLLKD